MKISQKRLRILALAVRRVIINNDAAVIHFAIAVHPIFLLQRSPSHNMPLIQSRRLPKNRNSALLNGQTACLLRFNTKSLGKTVME